MFLSYVQYELRTIFKYKKQYARILSWMIKHQRCWVNRKKSSIKIKLPFMMHTEQFYHITILLEKIWCQHQENRIEVTMVTVTFRSQMSHLHGDTWSDLAWYYIMKKIFKRSMKNNHQNRCTNRKFNIQKQKTHFLHLGAFFFICGLPIGKI